MIFFSASYGQDISVSTLLEAADVTPNKFDKYILKRGFVHIGDTFMNDTIVREYYYKGREKATDSILRSFRVFTVKPGSYFTYSTTIGDEYQKLKSNLKKEGFFCNAEQDSLRAVPLLFQKNDLSIAISSKQADTLTEYSFLVRKADLPKPKEIKYAEDLSVFDSHECLRYYFGDKNVKKDIYYLSKKEVIKCSILFPNSSMQAVFLWGDDVNNCNLKYICIGGQLMTESSLEYDKNVPENNWLLKNGIHAGMSLYSLRQLNDAAFDFYGGNSVNTGMVLSDSTGKVDFKTEHIILGCMNCSDRDFLKQPVLNSDDAIMDKRILFVHTIMLNASGIKQANKYKR